MISQQYILISSTFSCKLLTIIFITLAQDLYKLKKLESHKLDMIIK